VRLDHVSYVADHDHLVDVVQRIGSSLGAAFQDGGIHPRFGTRNFILPLHGGTYLEVVCPLDHPAADSAAFGQAVSQRAREGGGWLTWVVAVDDISTVQERVGREPVIGHRRRPDGFDLEWKQLGVKSTMEDPQLPFFVQWITDAAHSMTLKLFGLIPQTTMVNQVWLQYICVPNAALFVSINLK